jgi:hypothetical protein
MAQVQSPAGVAEAVGIKAGALSVMTRRVRMANGSPYSRNAASQMERTAAVSAFSTAWQRSR